MFSGLSIRFLAAATVLTICAGAYFSVTRLEWCARFHPLAGKARGAFLAGLFIFLSHLV